MQNENKDFNKATHWILRLKCNTWTWKNIGENHVYQPTVHYGFPPSDSIISISQTVYI